MRLKHAVEFCSGATPDTANEAFWGTDGEGAPWVAIGDMSGRSSVTATTKTLTSAGLADRRLRLQPAGTVLFAMYASVGAVSTLAVDAVWNQAILGLISRSQVAEGRFVAYWLRHYAPLAASEARAATQANLNAEQVANFPFPDFDIVEQRRIADFLDDRVARIDQIIAARAAQIAAAARGLDASWDAYDKKLRDGAPRVPLRRVLVSIVDGPFGSSLTSSHYSEEGARVIRLGNLGLAEFRDADKAYIPLGYAASLVAHQVVEGDLLMAGLGDERWPLGRCTVAPASLGQAIVKADCYRIRLNSRVSHDFAACYLSGPRSRSAFAQLARGATRARLNTDLARSAELPLVDHRDQAAYVECVQKAKHDAHETELTLQRSIDLLTEYKQSLITAAVTGELDVTTAGSGIPG